MMNTVVLIGRLTKDVELRTTNTGKSVASITLAVERGYVNAAGEKEVDYIPVILWEKNAENAAKYLAKGRLVAAEGRIQTRNYEDKDGKKVYVTEVVATEMLRYLDSKKPSSSSIPSDDELADVL
jgi:single-strand DNA-binding protein